MIYSINKITKQKSKTKYKNKKQQSLHLSTLQVLFFGQAINFTTKMEAVIYFGDIPTGRLVLNERSKNR